VGDAEKPLGEFTSHLGIRTLGLVDGAFTLELDLEPRHSSRAERVHGGVLFTLLDTALGRAVLAALPEGRGCATLEISIRYHRPVQRGRVRARGRVLELSKNLAHAEGEVVGEEGKVLARAQGTFFLTESLAQKDRERV
jgi:acyl-CoA thioesterase